MHVIADFGQLLAELGQAGPPEDHKPNSGRPRNRRPGLPGLVSGFAVAMRVTWSAIMAVVGA